MPEATSTSPTPEAAVPLVPPRETLACPACDYPIPRGADRCSECGFAPSYHDWDNQARRAYFMEFTRYSVVLTIVLCVVFGMLTPYFVAIIPLVVCLLATKAVACGVPKLYTTLARRAWLVSLPWLIMPWAILGTLVNLAIWSGFAADLFDSYGYGRDSIPVILHLSGRGSLGGVILTAIILLVTIACRSMWRYRWKRLCHLAAIPDRYRTSAVAVVGSRLAFYPGLFLAGAVFLICGVSQLLDFVLPGWDL